MLHSYVGQVENLRPIVNRPGAGPGKLLGRGNKPRFHRIHFDIADPPKLRFIANNPIVTFFLPKRFASEPQYSIGLLRGESLPRLHQLRNRHARSDQQMDVITHDNIAMDDIVREVVLSITNGLHNHFRDLGLPKIQRSCASVVEKAVHDNEGLSGCRGGSEDTTRRKTVVQAPRQEYRSINGVMVWQAARVKDRHQYGVGNSYQTLGPIINRPQANSLLHL